MFLPHWPRPLGKIDYKAGIKRVSEVLNRLGNPQNNMPPIIHVTGTNGKGSVVATVKSILIESGFRVHTYTSPHLINCNERIDLNGEKISDEYLFDILERIRPMAEDVNLTLFEGMTIAAIIAFSEIPAHCCVIEVGMGAMTDCTNVMQNKIITAITPISFDHVDLIGPTLADIAFEKAHIMKLRVPCIIASQPEEVMKILTIKSEDFDAPLVVEGEDYSIQPFFESESKIFRYFDDYFEYPKPILRGEYQIGNLGISLAIVKTLREYYYEFEKISEENIVQGISNVKWKSRLEKIENGKLVTLVKNHNSLSEIFIDGAHNPHGAEALAKWIKDSSEIHNNYLICGFTRLKSKVEFLEKFYGSVDAICGIRGEGEPYPENEEAVYEKILQTKIPAMKAPNLYEAILNILEISSGKPARIVICGSLYLARDVEKYNKGKVLK